MRYAKHFWYLATPYTKYEAGLEQANQDACEVSARLIRLGVPLFSPIAHSHAMTKTELVNPLDHDLWMWLDGAFMEAAFGLIVVKMDGWLESVGVQEELKRFDKMEKPIIKWDARGKDAARVDLGDRSSGGFVEWCKGLNIQFKAKRIHRAMFNTSCFDPMAQLTSTWIHLRALTRQRLGLESWQVISL